jgi:hypothetical protein
MEFKLKRTDDNNIIDAATNGITGTFKPGMDADVFSIQQVRAGA